MFWRKKAFLIFGGGLILFFTLLILIAVISSSKKGEIKTQVENLTATPSATLTTSATASSKTSAKVVKVIDGDTVSVEIGGKKETIRLIGIDAPESTDPRKPVQCFGIEASKKARELLSGKTVLLESDVTQGDRDKYQRLLRYIFLEDKTNINQLMISEGYAHEYTYSLPYKYQEEFKNAEKTAREGKKGLWADNACAVNTTIQSVVSITQPEAKTSPQAGGFTCSGKTKCGEMVSCEEAYFYLNTCGVSRLDGDKDGVPCESLCR